MNKYIELAIPAIMVLITIVIVVLFTFLGLTYKQEKEFDRCLSVGISEQECYREVYTWSD